MFLSVLGRRGVRAVRKTGERLLFVVFVNLEIVLRKVVYVIPFLVGDNSVDEHQARLLLDGLPDLDGRLGIRGRSGILRKDGRRKQESRQNQRKSCGPAR